MTRFRFPHPLVLLLGCVALAAALTWLLPAGEFHRRDDPVTARSVVVAGTYEEASVPVVGAAFGPIDPFLVGIAQRVADLPVVSVLTGVGYFG